MDAREILRKCIYSSAQEVMNKFKKGNYDITKPPSIKAIDLALAELKLLVPKKTTKLTIKELANQRIGYYVGRNSAINDTLKNMFGEE